ncbi:hypothetical protein I547_1018 [Mycobacterium kansasii 824]|uniref:Uncharacterized protein n=1 Tax=Mycobacterium kansasii TaxID=1768 RepID=A0A1V3XW26_MYCKA|nr:hypothetical protein I547_1018 [Mycobacterium kansasii 824]OOK83288.1 hypothetical protein BZL29_0401 [Mycobacterium kansasii]
MPQGTRTRAGYRQMPILLRRERRSRRATPAIAGSTSRAAIHIDIAIFLC